MPKTIDEVARAAVEMVKTAVDKTAGAEADVLQEFYDQFSDLLDEWMMRLEEIQEDEPDIDELEE